MELVFDHDKDLRLILGLYNTFGPPGAISRAEKSYPYVFGENFYHASVASRMAYELPGWLRTVAEFIHWKGEGLDSETQGKCKAIMDYARSKLFRPEAPEPLDAVAENLRENYKMAEEGIRREIRRIFGFELPERVSVVLSDSFYWQGGGGSFIAARKDDVLVSLEVSLSMAKNAREAKYSVPVLLHELLHGLIDNYGVIESAGSDKPSNWFEESLLDYFVPDGIMAYRLGLRKERTLKECSERSSAFRPYAKDVSKELLPLIEEYSRMEDAPTVWKFLSETKFGKYIQKVV